MGDPVIPGLVYACLTHVPLSLEFPPYVVPIYLGDAQGAGRLNLRDLAPEWAPHHPVLAGLAGTFALRNYVLSYHPSASRIGICQYRKFISRQRISFASEPTYSVMDLVHKGLLENGRIDDLMHPGTQEFLVSRAYPFGKHGRKCMNLFEQYKRAHHIEDFLRFTAAAVELGVLGKNEVAGFFDEKTLSPGGVELGVYEAGFWLKSVSQIEAVVRLCLAQHPAAENLTPRDSYQARPWAFCAERLGSYLLLQRFKQIDGRRAWAGRHSFTQRLLPSQSYIGQMNLITEKAGEGYALGSVKATA